MVDGYRESAQSWKELLLDSSAGAWRPAPIGRRRRRLGLLATRGLRRDQGAALLGPQDRQRAQPDAQIPAGQSQGPSGLTRADAGHDFFIAAYGAKYHKAAERLVKDRERLLSFYDFPAEHWKHIRTTNHRKTFATVRLRTVKTKGCLPSLAMVTGGNPIKSTDNQTRPVVGPSDFRRGCGPARPKVLFQLADIVNTQAGTHNLCSEPDHRGI